MGQRPHPPSSAGRSLSKRWLRWGGWGLVPLAGLLLPVAACCWPAEACDKADRSGSASGGGARARMEGEIADVYRTAETTYLIGDFNRASELFRRVITIGPGSSLIVRAHARLGIARFRPSGLKMRCRRIGGRRSWPRERRMPMSRRPRVRADYMVGHSALAARQYTQAFGQLRRFIDRHPGDALVNQAYQAIGDAHLALEQYQQALAAYRMVGTVLSEKTSSQHRITPGQRLYLRVTDADVNIGDTPKTVTARIKTTSGDVETVELQPLGLRSPVFIGSIPTALARPGIAMICWRCFRRPRKAGCGISWIRRSG